MFKYSSSVLKKKEKKSDNSFNWAGILSDDNDIFQFLETFA